MEKEIKIERSRRSSDEIKRPDLRPTMRDEDPRARAAARAAEIRGHLGELPEGTDEFQIPPDYIPDGWTYEWKRNTVYGQEDPAYQVQLRRLGWEPVPASRHPDMMPPNWMGETIERKGLILMERPREITEEARMVEYKRARNQVRAKEEQLNSAPDGHFKRNEHPQTKPKIKHGYEPMQIPADE